MTQTDTAESARNRIVLAALGALAGLAAWILIVILPERIDNDRLLLFLVAATGGFFAAFLAATGPLGFARAGLAAALAAGPGALLLTLASTRFDTVEAFFDMPHAVVAYLTILLISLPFLIAAQRPQDGWRTYSALFTQSWNIVVRSIAAWLFVGLFWGVILLSDTLFDLVGLTWIADLLDIDPVPYVLTGAVLGLALAVVVELSDYVSPFLLLRLLRLLLPVVLVVVVVFLVALPVRGLSDLFGGLSAAATLMAMALSTATLITSALDRDDDEAAKSRLLQIASQVLALAIPVMAGLAIYAIFLRVADYGWSPARLAAATLAAVTLGYGVLYAGAVLARRSWMARIRSANVVMALVILGLAVLWLTPVLNAERISAASQVARLKRGDVSVENLDLWVLGRDLGRAGTRALDDLREIDHPDAAALRARITRLDTATSRYDFNREDTPVAVEDALADFLSVLVVKPDGVSLPDDMFSSAYQSDLTDWAEACRKQSPAGHPGCVLIVADFVADSAGDEGFLLWIKSARRADLEGLRPGASPGARDYPMFLQGNRTVALSPGLIDDLHRGDFTLGPPQIITLGVGGATLAMQP